MTTNPHGSEIDQHSSPSSKRPLFEITKIRGQIVFVALLLASLVSPLSQAAPAGLKTLHGHVPEAVRRLIPKGELPGDKRLNLAIGIPLGNEAALSNFLERVYNPADPAFHRYVTPEEFAQQFAATPTVYEKVVAYAQMNHLSVTGRHTNRLVLDVNGSVADVEKAFHVRLQTYQHPTEDRDFYAPDSEPAVDAELPILDITGLNDFIRPTPRSVRMSSAAANQSAASHTGSGPGGAYLGQDFRAAYFPGSTLTGAGQILGLLQFDGFYASDIAAYENAAGLPQVPVQTVLLDGYGGTPTTGSRSGNPEVSLDIEMALSMAPGLSMIMVFEAGPNGLQNDILSAMTSHSEVKQFSCSWGWGGGPNSTTDNLFKQMAAQGQSFFSASGDSDAFPSGAVDDPTQVNAPSSCPYITVVGGTTLTTAGPGGSWASESVWNRGNGVGSSGGISSHYGLPSWQAGLNLGAAAGSSNNRNTPDVAGVAENVYVLYGNGTNGAFGGTSCAAPLWGAIAALMNQQAMAANRAPIGFINPAIYALGKSNQYGHDFHDITTGDNTWSSSPSAFYAVAGYDLCTGWGSPAGSSFIDALAGPADALSVSALAGLAWTGPAAGPFSPSTANLVVSNAGSTSLNWSLINTSAWLSVNVTQGTLPAGAAANVNVQLTGAAGAMAEGTYSEDLTCSNNNSGLAQNIACTLSIGQSIIGNGGFESGDFTDWSLTGRTVVNGTSGGPTVYNAVESNSSGYEVAHSGNYGAFLGDTQLATLSQTVSTLPGETYLLSFWLNNPTAGSGQHFQVNWNPSQSTANTIYSLDTPPAFGWTNLQFVVTASAGSSTLQFGAENDPAGFGLDDISLKPLPALGFSSVERLSNGLKLNWLSGSGTQYVIQYSTDLTGPWSNLGSSISGTGGVLSVTDTPTPGASTQRFYRLVALP